MDITYLLFLQDFRIAINDALTPFMEGISLFGITYIYLLPALVYWCFNKRNGLYVAASLSLSLMLNPVIKMTACVYRPWIRDARIIPAGDAIATAGGYSFPSGHTMTVTPIYGGLAVISAKTRKKLACLIWVVLILLTMFSRNYLGVHTPQDVLVGVTVSSLVLYVVAKIFNYLEANPERENLFLIIGFLLGIAALCYTKFKSYPMDYVDGNLLVDPEKMKISGVNDMALMLGFTVGRFIEKNFIKFKPLGWSFRGIILGAIGLAIMAVMIESLQGYCVAYMGAYAGRIATGFITMFYVVAIWPMVIRIFGGKR
ncbi:MAG: phosphatase PAP2 family protein [Synergistaceae bacterium]|nr:phosphatase PAP2 family protein [Synergistaceae bacterium]